MCRNEAEKIIAIEQCVKDKLSKMTYCKILYKSPFLNHHFIKRSPIALGDEGLGPISLSLDRKCRLALNIASIARNMESS